MPEIGYIYEVNNDELDRLIKIAGLINPVAILEKWFCKDGDRGEFFDSLKDLNEISEWDKGRVFDQDQEIRWERKGPRFHVLWIKHQGNITGDWKIEKLKYKGSRKILLWGKGNRKEDKKEWYEKQIPRILEYPVDCEGERAYLEITEYNLSDGSPVYRFKKVIEE